MIDLYDHEIAALQAVLERLRLNFSKPVNMEAARREVIERFQDAGFVVTVRVYSGQNHLGDQVDGVFPFEIEISGRCEPEKDGFDYDRQSHEVVNNLLDLPGEVKGRKVKFDPSQLHGHDTHHSH